MAIPGAMHALAMQLTRHALNFVDVSFSIVAEQGSSGGLCSNPLEVSLCRPPGMDIGQIKRAYCSHAWLRNSLLSISLSPTYAFIT